MATVNTKDDAIWVKHIEGSPELQNRVRTLSQNELIELEVGGVIGQWQKMKDGSDGRPTLGLKPVSGMKQVWSAWRKEPPRLVEIREVRPADSYLAALRATMAEWDSPEDEAAYRDL